MSQIENNEQNTQERIIPKLRFPEFQTTLGWSNKPLSKLANRITSKNKSGEITRVFTNSANDGVVDQSDYFDREIANKDNLNGYYIIELGDYVYNPRISTTAPVGPISKNKIAKGVMSPLYTVFRFHQTDNDFYEYYFKTNCWHKYLQHVSNSGARHDRMNITNDDFMAMPVPTLSHKEQQKIADCLSSIDELIELQEQKLAALKQHKKGLMQQLFPSHNDLQASKQASKQAIVYPKLRFPQFKDCKGWEIVELKDVAFINPKKEKLPDELKVSFIPMSSVSEHGKVNSFESRMVYEVKKGYTSFKDNDIIFAKITPCFENGKAALLSNLENGYGFGSTEFHVIRSQENCFPYFLFSQLYSDDLIIRGKQSMTGSAGQQRVPANFFENYLIVLPSLEEQQAIADCLSSLDKLISEEKEQIGRLKDHKKGLMQQLFPIFRN